MKYIVKVKGGFSHFTNDLPSDCDLDCFESIKENPNYEYELVSAALGVLEIAEEEVNERYSGWLLDEKMKVLNRLRNELPKEIEFEMNHNLKEKMLSKDYEYSLKDVAGKMFLDDRKKEMNKPHKHAELIKQWADGAEIQINVRKGDDWEDINPKCVVWADEYEYRIKTPEVAQWRKDFAQALNDGKIAQFLHNGDWHSTYWTAKHFLDVDYEFDESMFRIKPEPKPDIDVYVAFSERVEK